MRKNTFSNIKLGIFVSMTLTFFIAAIYFIGSRKQLFSSTFRISCMFSNVNGLQPGNNVRFAGINVGIVEDIQIITDSSVKVDVAIKKEIKKFIKKDATAIIGSEGLMGNKILIITSGPGSGGEIKDNDFILASEPINMEDIMAQLHKGAENVADITSDLNVVMKNIREGKGTVGKLFMDSTLAQNLGQSVVNIKEGSSGFKKNMDAIKGSFLLRRIFKKPEKKPKNKEKTELETTADTRKNWRKKR